MGWVERKAAPHFCKKPEAGSPPDLEFGDGSVWKCDDCGEDWIWEANIRGYSDGFVWYMGDGPKWFRLRLVLEREELQKQLLAESMKPIEEVPVKKRWWSLG